MSMDRIFPCLIFTCSNLSLDILKRWDVECCETLHRPGRIQNRRWLRWSSRVRTRVVGPQHGQGRQIRSNHQRLKMIRNAWKISMFQWGRQTEYAHTFKPNATIIEAKEVGGGQVRTQIHEPLPVEELGFDQSSVGPDQFFLRKIILMLQRNRQVPK